MDFTVNVFVVGGKLRSITYFDNDTVIGEEKTYKDRNDVDLEPSELVIFML